MAMKTVVFRIYSSSSIIPSPIRRRISPTLACLSSATDMQQQRGATKPNRKSREIAIRRDKEKRRTRSDKHFSFDVSPSSQPDGHVAVLLGEVLDVFSSIPINTFVDCTLGAAGHSSSIIKSHGEMENFLGIDVDPLAHERAGEQLQSCTEANPRVNIRTEQKNFKQVKSLLEDMELVGKVDGILMDLGMSSMQIDVSGRGFSMMADAPLDMRMDPQGSLRAKDILNTWPEEELGRILRDYGEEFNWRVLQKKILEERLYGGLHYTTELVDLIQSASRGQSGGRHGWIKTAIRVFQALRIAVNDELDTLEKSVRDCFECLAPGGRLAVISFHSLEDRIVKRAFLGMIQGSEGGKEEDDDSWGGNEDGEMKENWIKQIVKGRYGTILTRRPITPSTFEEKLNRRSRSAKLRVIQKNFSPSSSYISIDN